MPGLESRETRIYILDDLEKSTLDHLPTKSIIDNILVGRKFSTPFYYAGGNPRELCHKSRFQSFRKSTFCIYVGEKKLPVPKNILERLSQYIENISENDTQSNCKEFAEYITGLTTEEIDGKVRVRLNKDNIGMVEPGDIIYITSCPEGKEEKGLWHYYVFLGDEICVCKNGYGNASTVSLEKVDMTGMYRLI